MATKKIRKTGNSNKELGIKVTYSAMVKVHLPKSGQCEISISEGALSLKRKFQGCTKIFYIDLIDCDEKIFNWMQGKQNEPTS